MAQPQSVKKALKLQFEQANCCLWQDGDSPCRIKSSSDEHEWQERQTKQPLVNDKSDKSIENVRKLGEQSTKKCHKYLLHAQTKQKQTSGTAKHMH